MTEEEKLKKESEYMRAYQQYLQRREPMPERGDISDKTAKRLEFLAMYMLIN